jgi:hypothetical protein
MLVAVKRSNQFNIMSHQILQFDEQHGTSQAWHGLTQVNEKLRLSDPDFYLRRWNQIPAKVRPIIIGGENDGAEITAPDAEGLRAAYVISDSGNDEISVKNAICVSSVYDSTYTLLDNVKMIELIEKSLAECGISDAVSSVGSVFNRRRTFVSIPLAGLEKFSVGDRPFAAYLNFINSTDGTTRFQANVSNICTVCNNTLTFNLGAGGFLVKHSKNMGNKLEMLPDVLALAIETQKDFANEFLKMASEAIDAEKAEAWFVAFVAGDDAKSYSVNSQNRVARLLELFRDGKGNTGKTVADAVSAVTDFYTHEAANGQDDTAAKWKNHLSSEFGTGAARKSEFLAIAKDSKKRNAMIAKGRSVRKLALAA